MVVEDGDTVVRITSNDGELHGGGYERWSGGVEIVDGGADEGELGLVGTIN